ncbi:MAG: ABC transporter ATP-binding protein [Kiritimatiellae bacterium]|nr:ABC transporter ATP-binding protein [Kiritimatiellia bacterium]
MSATPAIRFERVVKRLGGRLVLDEVSFEVQRGEVFVIVGASGSGKSVTLKHMVRLLTPDEGRVWVGEDCISEARGRRLAELRDRFGVLFQSSALLQWMTVEENVALPLREKTALSEPEIAERVHRQLAALGLEDAADKFPADLSGGMQKRVGLARAMVLNPEIILYDEPTSGLDPVTSRRIDDLILELRQQHGITSVVVTHDLHSALAIATRIAVIHQGRVVEVRRPAEFLRSTNEIVRSFLDAQYITRRGAWEMETIQ